jgi:hypothetical protein
MTEAKTITIDDMLTEVCHSAQGQRTAALATGANLADFSFYVAPGCATWLLRLGSHHAAFMQGFQGMHTSQLEKIYSPTSDVIGVLMGVPVRLRRLIPDGHLLLWPDALVRAMESGEKPWMISPPPDDKLN